MRIRKTNSIVTYYDSRRVLGSLLAATVFACTNVSAQTLDTSFLNDGYLDAGVYSSSEASNAFSLGLGQDVTDRLSLSFDWAAYGSYQANSKLYQGELESTKHELVTGNLAYNYPLSREFNIGVSGGYGVLFTEQVGNDYVNKDHQSAIKLSLFSQYRVNKYLDVYASYDHAISSDYTLGTFGVGAQFYWYRNNPSINIVSDNELNQKVLALKNESIKSIGVSNELLKEVGYTRKDTSFNVISDGSVKIEGLDVSIGGQVHKLQVVDGKALLNQRIPKGTTELSFLVRFANQKDEIETITNSYTVKLYTAQGMEFIIEILDSVIGKEINVKAL